MNCNKCGKSICWVERDNSNGLCDECAEEKEQMPKEMKNKKEEMFVDNIEIWKDIKNYEGIYQISNLGRIKSLQRIKTKASKLGNIFNYYPKEKILKTRKSRAGYLYIGLTDRNKNLKSFRVHRLVAICFILKIQDKDIVNHKDGNKTNNSIENLEWCTPSENMQHAFNTGLTVIPILKGEEHGRAKCTEKDVREMRRLYVKCSRQFGSPALGKKYNISKSNALRIVKNILWRNII